MQDIWAPEGVLNKKDSKYVKLVQDTPNMTSSEMNAASWPCIPENAFVLGNETIKITNTTPVGM